MTGNPSFAKQRSISKHVREEAMWLDRVAEGTGISVKRMKKLLLNKELMKKLKIGNESLKIV